MSKLIWIFLPILGFLILANQVIASANSYVTVVNPIRGKDFWQEAQAPVDVVKGESQVLDNLQIPATWLIRVDALSDAGVLDKLKSLPSRDELGLFLEVTPTWTSLAGVSYNNSPAWQFAGSVFLTGYSQQDRIKLLDSAFAHFKDVVGYYPKSVGAWWIDSFSLNYLENKYKIASVLIVADQYTTDNYQIWGQYWATPYYPAKKDLLIPAQSVDDKQDVVVFQWAARDPVNGYGKGVEESTYSVQANDYLDYHKLTTEYFSKLVDTYTKQNLNSFNQLTVGMENSYSWAKYQQEYLNQMQLLVSKQKTGQFQFKTMSDFSSWYRSIFPNLSPEHIIVADDPLGSSYKTVWFMDQYYRIGWFYNQQGSVIRYIRQYLPGLIEPCYDQVCTRLDFATFSDRVLDDVTYGKNWLLDQGTVSNISVSKQGTDYLLNYTNAAGNTRTLKFLPRDIFFDGKIKTIDGAILDALNQKAENIKIDVGQSRFDFPRFFYLNLILNGVRFIVFVLLCLIFPGTLILNRSRIDSMGLKLFLSLCLGIVNLTLVTFFFGYLKIRWAVNVYLIISLLLFAWENRRVWRRRIEVKINLTKTWFVYALIIFGTIYLIIPVFKSGINYNQGEGFWGPNGHDGIWHMALINQLVQNVPPSNPIFSGQVLSNYHYFYDLLVSESNILTDININDLIYRFYPPLLSLSLGFSAWFIARRFFVSRLAQFFAIFFVYFSGSFGWIVELIKSRQLLAGESDFWANQPISFNLNPPFAISLVLLSAAVLLYHEYLIHQQKLVLVALVLISGSLIEFKVYAGIIVLLSLLVVGIYQLLFVRKAYLLLASLFSFALSGLVFLPQNSNSSDLLVISPFWFINSMIDFPDRVGWAKLAAARSAYYQRGEWPKFILIESASFLIFLFGNLGTRILTFLMFPVYLLKKSFLKGEYLLILSLVLTAFLIPVIFIQKGNPWNTIQFIYYFLFFFAIWAGGITEVILRRYSRFGVLIVFVILLITPISSFSTFKGYIFETPHSFVSNSELEALNFLKGQTKGDVLTYPFDQNLKQKFNQPYPLLAYDTTAYVSAFSGKPTFMEDEIQQEIFQNDYKKRIVSENDFFSGRDYVWSKQFLRNNNISYIYLPKIYHINLDTQALDLKQVFENQEVLIYRR